MDVLFLKLSQPQNHFKKNIGGSIDSLMTDDTHANIMTIMTIPAMNLLVAYSVPHTPPMLPCRREP